MTDECLEEAKSLVESEEKQSWWPKQRSLGSLDTWREEDEGEGRMSFILVPFNLQTVCHSVTQKSQTHTKCSQNIDLHLAHALSRHRMVRFDCVSKEGLPPAL